MSLSASMWTGVSGLLGHGEKMNVVGNNLANISTVGFKAQRMDFQDFMYKNTYSASGTTQMGRGVQVQIIMGDFSQGAFETTTSAVDLAIAGQGYFGVQKSGTDELYYTRAGNFRFQADGYLTDPNGYEVQGWRIDNTNSLAISSGGIANSVNTTSTIKGTGVPESVRLDTWTVPPQQTTHTSIITVLAANGSDNSTNPANPFASLLQAWDGTAEPPIAEVSYAYSTSIKVYDEAGIAHTMTIYYDKVSDDTYEGNAGETLWEYMVTIEPSEDNRQVYDSTLGAVVNLSDTKMGGVLMSGVMSFSSSGDLLSQTAYTLYGSIEHSVDASGNPIPDANYVWVDPSDTSKGLVPVVTDSNTLDGITQSFYPAAVSNSGYPLLVANFTGQPNASTVGSPSGHDYMMEFNLGLRVSDLSNPWTVSSTTSLYDATMVSASGNEIVVNKYYTSDGLNGPKVVEVNPDFNADMWADYEQVIAGNMTQAQFNAIWVGNAANLNPSTGLPYTNAEARRATWPYMATSGMNQWFTGDASQTANFIDQTPHTSSLGWVSGTPNYDANRTQMLGTSYATGNGTSQNGYTFGNLSGYDVDSDGILYGYYSNGVTLPLYQLTLYNFTCEQGLRREGGNLFSQTMDSGEAMFAAANTYGMGSIASYSLELSNVDMSTEFVQMISTQRGFQANSKVITTTDTMLETVISMKR